MHSATPKRSLQNIMVESSGRSSVSVEGEKSLKLATIYKVGFRWFKIVRFRRIPRTIRALIDFGRVYLPVSEEEYYLYFLAVMLRFRGRDIGRQLIKFAEFQAR